MGEVWIAFRSTGFAEPDIVGVFASREDATIEAIAGARAAEYKHVTGDVWTWGSLRVSVEPFDVVGAPRCAAFPLRTEADLARAHDLIAELRDAEPGTPDGDLRDVMEALSDQYQRERAKPEETP